MNLQQRDSNADFIRNIAMLMVCILHVSSMSGFSDLTYETDFYGKHISNTWLSPCRIAVNLYAMLTGYLCINKKWNPQRYIELWLQVCFYSFILYIPAIVMGEYKLSLFSVFFIANPTIGLYWYFAAYTGLYILIPFINKGLLALSKSQFQYLITFLIVVYSGLSCLGPAAISQDGHNAVWLTILYIIGAYIKMYPVSVKTKYLILCYIVMSAITYWALIRQGFLEKRLFWGYSSISTTLGAMAFFVISTRINFSSAPAKRILMQLSPMAFGVFLIHTHPFVWSQLQLITRQLAEANNYSWWCIPFAAIVIYIVCSVIDWVRIKFFQLVHIKQLSAFITSRLPSGIKKLED